MTATVCDSTGESVGDRHVRKIGQARSEGNAMGNRGIQAGPESPTTIRTKQRLEDLPAPSALPWLGNLHQLDPKRLHAQLEAWCHALGPTFTFKLGPKRILVTSNVEIALSALRHRPGRFRRLSTIEPVAAEMGMNGVFSIEGDPRASILT
jgi:hypothetical protein